MEAKKTLYGLLEVSETATEAEIKAAFRKKALMHHPDRGGDESVFKKVNQAYQVLSDPEQRRLYDSGSEQAESQFSSFPAFNPMELLNKFMFAHLFHKEEKKCETIQYKQPITLEQLVSRSVVKLEYERTKVCNRQHVKEPSSCPVCNGRGSSTQIRNIGFLQQHVQQSCTSCSGSGKRHSSCDQCKDALVTETVRLEFTLEPTMFDGYQKIFLNEGNTRTDATIGDLVVVIQHVEHPRYKVNGVSLIHRKTITLREALCGHSFDLIHPSGEILSIVIQDVIVPGSKKVISEKGLTRDGTLEIEYDVQFPESLTKEQIVVLDSILR